MAVRDALQTGIFDPCDPIEDPAPPEWVTGVDVSHWNKPAKCDYQAMREGGVLFAGIKATEGTSKDRSFREHCDGFIDAGIQRMAYHFAYMKGRGKTTASAVKQCDAFVRRIETIYGGLELRAVLDLEWQRHPGKTSAERKAARLKDYGENSRLFPHEAVTAWTLAFGERCRQLLGHFPTLYTGDSFFKHRLGLTKALVDWPLWQIEYTGDGRRVPESFQEIPAKVSMCPPWISPAIWQFANNGKIPGYEGKIDRNLCLADTLVKLAA